MIRYVQLDQDEFGEPECAFLNTVSDRFLDNRDGTQTFSREDIDEHPECDRLWRLVPKSWR